MKAPKSKEAVFGTLVHETLKFMFSRDPLFPTLEEALAKFREGMAASQISDTEKSRYEETGTELLTKFWKKNPPWNFNVVDLESRFEIVLEDHAHHTTHTLAGIIDRIDKQPDGTFEVIDYKTSRRLPSQQDTDCNLQLSLYHLAVTKRWPHVDPAHITLSLYYLKAGEKLSTARSTKDLKETEQQVLEQIHDIEQKTKENFFPPRPSPLCEWCGYKPMCPAWKHLYKKQESPPLTKQEIDSVIAEYLQIKERMDTDKKRLAELSGPINTYLDTEQMERLFTEDKILSRSIQERIQWDNEKVKAVLAPCGKWDEVTALDTKKLTKAAKTYPEEIKQQLKNASVAKRFTVLKVSKNKSAAPDTDNLSLEEAPA